MAENETKGTVELAADEKKLSDGRIAKFIPGKGKHAIEAMKICGGETEKFLPALMSQLVLIDGKAMVMEDVPELDLKDYMLIQVEVAGKNF